jgi:hypothetical protein
MARRAQGSVKSSECQYWCGVSDELEFSATSMLANRNGEPETSAVARWTADASGIGYSLLPPPLSVPRNSREKTSRGRRERSKRDGSTQHGPPSTVHELLSTVGGIRQDGGVGKAEKPDLAAGDATATANAEAWRNTKAPIKREGSHRRMIETKPLTSRRVLKEGVLQSREQSHCLRT